MKPIQRKENLVNASATETDLEVFVTSMPPGVAWSGSMAAGPEYFSFAPEYMRCHEHTDL